MSSTAQNQPAQQASTAELQQRVREGMLQLEATARELDAVGAALSHDLRAPLRSIEGFSRLLLQPPRFEQLDPTARDYLQRIHSASLRLGEMMEALLQLVRLARSGVKSERVDLSGIAQDILAGLRACAPERGAEISIQPGVVVAGDPQLLRVALESLLGNAWKFTSRKEVADISFARVADEGVPALCVRDNGAGFEQKYADRLFRAFQRLHAETEFEGAGIGLARAQRAIHAQGGRIWARAQRGAGAAFYFTLPGMSAASAEAGLGQ